MIELADNDLKKSYCKHIQGFKGKYKDSERTGSNIKT